MPPLPMKFHVTKRQMAGDVALTLFSVAMGFGVIYLFMYVLLAIVVFDESTSGAAIYWSLFLTTVLMGLLLWKMPMPWWSISLENDEVVFKTLQTLRIRNEAIVFVHAGLEVGMQNGGNRSSAVPLTVEERSGRKSKIQLAPVDAQACIDHLTNACAWIGAMNVDGTTIIPRDPAAARETRKRLGHTFLYSGVSILLLGLFALAMVWSRGMTIFEENGNPVMVLLGLLAIVSCIGYGVWAIGKYRALQRLQAP